MFGLELNKQMATLASQELNLKSQKIEEIFPIVDQKYKDIFTPPDTRQSVLLQEGESIFMT